MNRALGLMFAAVVAGIGCGDNFEAPALTPEQLFVKLRFLPGVTVEEAPTLQPGFHYYILRFTQPIDHQNPSLGTFQQQVTTAVSRCVLTAAPSRGDLVVVDLEAGQVAATITRSGSAA